MDENVQVIKISYIIRDYRFDVPQNLGEIPRGMKVDSCRYTASFGLKTVVLNGNIKLARNEMIFTGEPRKNNHKELCTTVHVGFVPE